MPATEAPAPKGAVRAAFDKAAAGYDAVAAVQRAACDRLLALALAQGFVPRRLLDAGCGTGYALEGLARAFPEATRVALDFAPAMLRRHPPGRALPLCADLEQLPIAEGALDALWSSYALQWCEPRRALPELARSLRPGGQLWLATLGPGTLGELRAAFAEVDGDAHVLRFAAPETVLEAAEAAGLRVRATERADLYAWAPDLRRLLGDIKTLGAHQTGAPRRASPLGKRGWARLSAAYEAYRQPAGLPATYDTFWLIAEKR